MSTRKQIVIALAGIMLIPLLVSCSKSTTAVLPTNTPTTPTLAIPTKTPTLAKATVTPTSTPIDLSGLVAGTPVPEWKEIPLMPGALAGNENDTNYLYTTSAKSTDVITFYTRELPKLGWEPKPGNGTPEPGGVLTLVFFKGDEACLVAIVPQQVGTLVMLGRQAK